MQSVVVTGSFATHLAGMDEAALTALLHARPDVRTVPAPRDFDQLAERLSGPASLTAAMQLLNEDLMAVGRAIAALGTSATVVSVARLLDADEHQVHAAVTELSACGLAWIEVDRPCLPEPLAQHWAAEIGRGKPAATIARTVYVDELRATADALGIASTGLRKAELVTRVVETMTDVRGMAARVSALPKKSRDQLRQLRFGVTEPYYAFRQTQSRPDQSRPLAEAGLLLRVNHRWEVPWEVAVASWLAETAPTLSGPPDLAPTSVPQTSGRAAAEESLRTMTGLLDEASATPIPALKKGGIGTRERTRWASRLAVSDDAFVLSVDLAFAAGLLGPSETGYAPTTAYRLWRDEPPARQWAALIAAWFELEHAPTSREGADDKDVPPPLPLGSTAGVLRRALLRAAAGGRSVAAAGERIDWFCPFHGYPPQLRATKIAAAMWEAEFVGVLAGDALTEYGETLVVVADAAEPETLVEDLAHQVRLPDIPCSVTLQSDLTAVVAGRPSPDLADLLAVAAAPETKGAAGVWRFTPETVRAALDAGTTAESLLAQLAGLSDRPLPQPLEFLVNDVARRHGRIRVRDMLCCVVADEVTITELLHTRSLAGLDFARLAPTVLSSPHDRDTVLTRLRASGHAPTAEDSSGAVIVRSRQRHVAPEPRSVRRRVRSSAAELCVALVSGVPAAEPEDNEFTTALRRLNPRLGETEIALLADAVANDYEVIISYLDKNRKHTVRPITPHGVRHKWLEAWCHLAEAHRDFTVANILAVEPID
ncbi:helicase-associated domain-containing protein [Nocardia sp. NBC_01377]|uniref:helicase-associated domain-containing protein n=1 Tax=Nocardia sp. NBC_01377 TaxID=2903595 RepID=UPI00324D0DA5